jgi:tRNA-dihydrouridine synthase B
MVDSSTGNLKMLTESCPRTQVTGVWNGLQVCGEEYRICYGGPGQRGGILCSVNNKIPDITERAKGSYSEFRFYSRFLCYLTDNPLGATGKNIVGEGKGTLKRHCQQALRPKVILRITFNLYEAMMEHYKRFGLMVNDQIVRTPVAVASMAGIVDAAYVRARESHIGAAFIGGYSLDGPTLEAGRMMAAEGRNEFLHEDVIPELRRQIALMKGSQVVLGINMRGSSPDAYRQAAGELGDTIVYEIDAHCRQPPMVEAGCGEYYLKNPKSLVEVIKALKCEEVTVSVKIRAGVASDDRSLARTIWKAGADIIHVDLMDFGHQRLKQIRNSCPITLIANNSVNTFDRMKDLLSHGADMVSLARKSDERTLAGLDAAITRYADEHGWYNSPKQLCRGGDIRALAFCCMPVKSCPLIPTLDNLGLARDEYIRLKESAVKDTPLETGKNTCFGSLSWCCKDSSPCVFRDMTIMQAGLSNKEYMRLKRQLSERLVNHIFYGSTGNEVS